MTNQGDRFHEASNYININLPPIPSAGNVRSNNDFDRDDLGLLSHNSSRNAQFDLHGNNGAVLRRDSNFATSGGNIINQKKNDTNNNGGEATHQMRVYTPDNYIKKS